MKNPFRGLRFSLLDFQSARANAGMKIAMLGIALIPLIYGAMYLMAFYDPYGKLDTLPVAVVNEDVPVRTEDGKMVHAGEDLVAELKDSDALQWHFVDDAAEAQKGLESGKYYNTVIIPADFSEKIASADTSAPQKAHLELVVNDANNYLSSILGASVMRVVTSETNYSVGENYYVQIFDKIASTGDDLQKAADGAAELADGMADAHDGSQKITDGLVTARDGSKELAQGMGDAHSGSATSPDGLKPARDGAHQLADVTVAAADGAGQLAGGLGSAKDGATQLADGVKTASDGSATITEKLKEAADGAATLDSGLKQLSEGLASGQTGSAQLAAGLHQLQTEGSGKLASGANALNNALNNPEFATKLATLDGGAKQVADGTNQLSEALGGLSGTIDGMSANVAGLQDQLNDIKADAQTLAGGFATAGGKLQKDADTAMGHASSLGSALGGLTALTGKVGDASTAAGTASSRAADAAGKAGEAQGHAAAASGSANEAAGKLGSLAKDEESGRYYLSEEDYSALMGMVQTAASEADAASGSAAEAKGAAGEASAYATGVKGGLDEAAGALSGIDTQALGTLAGDLQTIGGDLQTIKQGAAGLDGVTSKSQTLIDNSQSAIDGASQLVAGLKTKLGQAQALSIGAQQVSEGVSQLVASLTTDGADAAGTPTLHAAASQLAAGAQQVDEKMLAAAGAADQLTDGWKAAGAGAGAAKNGSSQLAGGLSQLHAGSQQLSGGLVTATTGANALKAGLGTLYAGADTLAHGLGDAKSGSAQLAGGLDQLHDGSATLTDGLATAKAGSDSLVSGLGQLHDGSATLTDGLKTAQDGSVELSNGLADGVAAVKESTADSDKKAQMMSEPVTLEQTKYTTVDNYGSGFAPYFIALGLWVGSLVMTFLFDPLNKRLIMSGASPAVAAFAGLVPMLIVGAIQALLIAFTIQYPCHISVAHPLPYYLLCLLASFVFTAIVQAVIALFGFPGKFVAVVLLMLQLTTAAGTFPIETEFPIFQAMSPYLPMTYVVRALRQAMAGIDLSLLWPSVSALFAFLAASYALTCLVARRKRLVTMMDLHPLVDL